MNDLTTPLKHCPKCQTIQPLDNFSTDRNRPDGHNGYCKACRKMYRTQNRERLIATTAKWNRDNPERFTEHVRKSQQKWPEKTRTHWRTSFNRRRARKASLPDTLTTIQWEYALNWFGGCCAYCGRRPDFWQNMAMEHFMPLASPDCPGTTAANILPACNGPDGCNTRKNAQAPEKWVIETFGKSEGRRILARIAEYFAVVRSANG